MKFLLDTYLNNDDNDTVVSVRVYQLIVRNQQQNQSSSPLPTHSLTEFVNHPLLKECIANNFIRQVTQQAVSHQFYNRTNVSHNLVGSLAIRSSLSLTIGYRYTQSTFTNYNLCRELVIV